MEATELATCRGRPPAIEGGGSRAVLRLRFTTSRASAPRRGRHGRRGREQGGGRGIQRGEGGGPPHLLLRPAAIVPSSCSHRPVPSSCSRGTPRIRHRTSSASSRRPVRPHTTVARRATRRHASPPTKHGTNQLAAVGARAGLGTPQRGAEAAACGIREHLHDRRRRLRSLRRRAQARGAGRSGRLLARAERPSSSFLPCLVVNVLLPC